MQHSNGTTIWTCLLILIFLCMGHLYSANPQDVVINEIAWMGTAFSSNHEWIELYNQSSQDIDLTGWVLSAADDSPTIQLEGTITAQGYFFLERSDDSNISIVADQIYTGALSNSGENLQLKDDLDQIIDQVDCSEGWFGGDNTSKATMEKKHPCSDGCILDSWGTNDSLTVCGTDQNGSPILGTPKSQNSVYDVTLSILMKDRIPSEYAILKNYPNPFNPKTVIRYHLNVNSQPDKMEICIYNLKGEMIRTFSNLSNQAGTHEVTWDGCDAMGRDVSSGLYICRLSCDHRGLKSLRLLKIK